MVLTNSVGNPNSSALEGVTLGPAGHSTLQANIFAAAVPLRSVVNEFRTTTALASWNFPVALLVVHLLLFFCAREEPAVVMLKFAQ